MSKSKKPTSKRKYKKESRMDIWLAVIGIAIFIAVVVVIAVLVPGSKPVHPGEGCC